MNTEHTPDPAYLRALEDRIAFEAGRRSRFAPAAAAPAFGRRLFAAVALVVVLVAGVSVVSAGLESANRKRLLEKRARIITDTASTRHERMVETLVATEQAFKAGLLPESRVVEARQRARTEEIRLDRAKLDLAEVESSGEMPRDDVTAPRVGDRDFVVARLTLDLALAELDAASAGRERMRAIESGATAFGSDEERESTLNEFEARWVFYASQAAQQKSAGDTLVRDFGGEEALVAQLQSLSLSLRDHQARLDQQRAIFARGEQAWDEVEAYLKRWAQGEPPPGDGAPQIEPDERVMELDLQLMRKRSELTRLREDLGSGHPRLQATAGQIKLLETMRNQMFRLQLESTLRIRRGIASELGALAAMYEQVRAELENLSRKKSVLDGLKSERERHLAEADRYFKLWEKLEAARNRPGPAAAPPAVSLLSCEIAARRVEQIRRRLDLRKSWLDGELPPERAALLAERSLAVFRQESAALRLEAERKDHSRVRRQYEVGLAPVTALRESQAKLVENEADAKLAEIDVKILDERLAD